MQLRSGKMVSPRPHEETSSTGDTSASQITNVGSSAKPTVSIPFNGIILTSCQPQTPMPTMGTSGQYMPSFTVPLRRTLGMPNEFMANMHNLGSTFGETSSLSFSHYQGLGPLASQFGRPPGFGLSSQSVPTFSLSSVTVMRQHMDESNHEMVHMLTQQMGTIMRHLIQDSTQSYQQLATQMTRIRDFLGASRAQVRQNPPTSSTRNPSPARGDGK